MKAINFLIYIFIFCIIAFTWSVSSDETRNTMVYALITFFPILSLKMIHQLWKK